MGAIEPELAFAQRRLPMRRTQAKHIKSSVQHSHTYKLARRVMAEVASHDITSLSAELAYRGMLAIFPFFIFVGAVSGYAALIFHVDNPAQRIIDHTGSALPPDAAAVLRRQLQVLLEARHPGLLTLGLAGAIFTASAAMNTIIKSLNRVYGIKETRSFWERLGLSLGLTVLAGLSLIAAFVLLVFGQIFGRQIADQAGMGSFYGTLVSLARWPLVLALVLCAATVVYRYAPARRLKVPWASPGALFFTITWLITTFLFALFISHSRSYQATYGAIAGIIILMVWLYMTAFVFLVGGEVNRLLGSEFALPRETSR
jgi:membrane protein